MNLEFPRINLEFLEIASAFSKPRNDGDLMRLLPLLCSLAMTQGILEFLEIASVAVLPRNDGWHSRIPYRDPRVKPEDDIVGILEFPKKHLLTPTSGCEAKNAATANES